MDPTPTTTQRGAPAPLWKPPHKLKPFCSTVEASRRTVRGRIQRGGRSPLIGRRGGGIHKGGTPSKGSLPYAVFWSLFVRTKSDPGHGAGEAPYSRGTGAEPPKAIDQNGTYSEEKIFLSHPPADGRISPASARCAGTGEAKTGVRGLHPTPPYGHILTSTRRRPSTLATAIARTTAAPTAPQAAGGTAATTW